MSLTVSEIAERIRKPSDEKSMIVERLRHWTREGLISTSGEKNPGTGRKRRYDESVLKSAAILNAMADIGLQLNMQRYVLQEANRALDLKTPPEKVTNISTNFLVIQMHVGPPKVFHSLWDFFNSRPRTETTIVLDLALLFARLANDERAIRHLTTFYG